MVQLLREGHRARAVPRRHDATRRPARTRPPRAGPYSAPTGPQLAPGEVRFDSAAPQTILPTAGSTAIAAPFDPITGPGACATTSATDQADTATYRMDPVPDRRLHAAGLADGGGRHHLAGLRLADRGAAARRRHRHEHADPGRARPVAAGDHGRPRSGRCSSCTRTATGSPTATW